MSPGYIDYIENHAANVTAEALVRLATGLETTGASLLGEGAARPAGGGPPARGPRLDHLSEAECRELIAPGGVGRVVFSTEHGPEALPVNYSLVNDELIFRAAPHTTLAAVIGSDVGFEVDRLDEGFSEGWSVLVAGPASKITEPVLVWQFADAVKSWAGGDRDVFIRIEPRRITGRRIASAAGP
jgi:hypothetical protein